MKSKRAGKPHEENLGENFMFSKTHFSRNLIAYLVTLCKNVNKDFYFLSF